MTGPLAGLRVVELAGLGPAPFAAMILADLGADVVRVERPGGAGREALGGNGSDLLLRGRRVIELDLKQEHGRDGVLDLVAHADVLIEGLRPGVTERLGIGPQDCIAINPRLVYARMTGWGQDGPLASSVGHDLNYLGLTGALHAMGRPDQPPPVPLNLIADMGGGAMLLLVGVLSALLEAQRSGQGQVVDAAMVDGTVLLSQLILSLRAMGQWSPDRGANLLDGGAPFYSTYACADDRYVAVGALEPRFYAALLEGLGCDESNLPDRFDSSSWPSLRELFAERFAQRSRDEWVAVFSNTDACVTPVLSFDEAAANDHLMARRTYRTDDGHLSAAAAPRFSRTPAEAGALVPEPVSVRQIAQEWALHTA